MAMQAVCLPRGIEQVFDMITANGAQTLGSPTMASKSVVERTSWSWTVHTA